MERGKKKGDSDSEDVEQQSLTGIVSDRVHSLRLYDEDDPSYREAIDRVQTSETPEKPPTGSSVISSQVDQIGTEDVEHQSLTGIVSDREEIDRVLSLRFYKTDDSYDREEKDRVHSLCFYKTDDSYDREEKDRVHSLRFYKTDDSYDREAKDRVHSLQKTSETPDFPKLSEKPPHGVISSQVNQIGTVSEVVKMAKDAQGSVVMSQTSGETNDSFTADLSVGVIKSGAPCRGERLAKFNQVNQIGTLLLSGHIKSGHIKKTSSPKDAVEQPSLAKLSSYTPRCCEKSPVKQSDPSHRKTAADIFKEDPSD